MSDGTVKLIVDGREVEVAKGTLVIEAVREMGGDVPHYCWHPGLTVAGNCRICMVEVDTGRGRQTVISCNLPVSEGMQVWTQSDPAKQARQDVMELLLINHPLDCPICDQAGECKLQEYSFEFGTDGSRFDFPKVHKPKNVEFSDKVMFDAERCILCTRCVRFCEEIAGEDELDVVNRGDRNEIAVARGDEMKNPYQMNTIDICPVGALTSTDFRFKSRVWFIDQKRTVCPSCSRGCNVTAGTRWNRILRLVPAENADVNQWWMCDAGRLNFKYVEADDRLGAPMVRKDGELVETTWDEAFAAAADGLRAAGADLLAIVSARLTNEELWLSRRILDELGTPHRDTKPRAWPSDDILRTGDGNPNTAGAKLMGIAPQDGGRGLGALAGGGFKAVFLCGEDMDDDPAAVQALAAMDFVLVTDFHETETIQKAATVVLPGLTAFEKDGSFTNVDGRAQRIQPVVTPPGDARPDWRILGSLLARLTGEDPPRSADAVLQAMGDDVPAFAGMTLGRLGPLGKQLPAPVPAPVSTDGGIA